MYSARSTVMAVLLLSTSSAVLVSSSFTGVVLPKLLSSLDSTTWLACTIFSFTAAVSALYTTLAFTVMVTGSAA